MFLTEEIINFSGFYTFKGIIYSISPVFIPHKVYFLHGFGFYTLYGIFHN